MHSCLEEVKPAVLDNKVAFHPVSEFPCVMLFDFVILKYSLRCTLLCEVELSIFHYLYSPVLWVFL